MVLITITCSIFETVAEEGSLRLASQILQVSQPNISGSICLANRYSPASISFFLIFPSILHNGRRGSSMPLSFVGPEASNRRRQYLHRGRQRCAVVICYALPGERS